MIRIYGASDDLVEFDGVTKPEEIDCHGQDVHLVIGQAEAKEGANASGLRVWLHYTDLGVWAATVLQIEEGVPIPWPVHVVHAMRGASEIGYSVVVEIDAPKDTPVSWQVVDARSY